MKKILISIFVLCSMAIYSDVISEIDAEYQELLEKEAEKVEEFKAEKLKLEEELVELRAKGAEKEKTLEKLKKDSEIRWHRDEYKKLTKKYEEYYKNLDKTILDNEAKIEELTKLLYILE